MKMKRNAKLNLLLPRKSNKNDANIFEYIYSYLSSMHLW